jgi:glutathione S-transferase
MNCGLRIRLREIPSALLSDIGRLEELWSQGLDRFGGPWLAGASFGAVDAFFAPVAFRIQTYALPLGLQAQAYVDRLLALPAMAQWYREGLAERWRDAAHEAEVPLVGEVAADFRAV